MPYVKSTNTDPTKTPDTTLPLVNLSPLTQNTVEDKREILPIEDISRLMRTLNSSASVAPTYNPRNLYEQIIIKDSGTISKLWVWSPTNGWRNTNLT